MDGDGDVVGGDKIVEEDGSSSEVTSDDKLNEDEGASESKPDAPAEEQPSE
jgi:hypothetical protein